MSNNNGKFGLIENEDYVIRMAMENIKPYEGFRDVVYKCPAGFDTIGWGHNVEVNGLPPYAEREMAEFGKISETTALKLLREDVLGALRDLVSVFGAVLVNSWSMNRKIALINMFFQLGLTKILDPKRGFPKMIQFAKLGKWEMTANEMLDSDWARFQTPKRAKAMSGMVRSG